MWELIFQYCSSPLFLRGMLIISWGLGIVSIARSYVLRFAKVCPRVNGQCPHYLKSTKKSTLTNLAGYCWCCTGVVDIAQNAKIDRSILVYTLILLLGAELFWIFIVFFQELMGLKEKKFHSKNLSSVRSKLPKLKIWLKNKVGWKNNFFSYCWEIIYLMMRRMIASYNKIMRYYPRKRSKVNHKF